jgi:hypothetical protein
MASLIGQLGIGHSCSVTGSKESRPVRSGRGFHEGHAMRQRDRLQDTTPRTGDEFTEERGGARSTKKSRPVRGGPSFLEKVTQARANAAGRASGRARAFHRLVGREEPK